jgi:hypothetical protein
MRIAILVLIVVARAAHAEAPSEPKSEEAAFWWSAGGTLASVALIGVGTLIEVRTDTSAGGYNLPEPTRVLGVTARQWGGGMIVAGALGTFVAPAYGHFVAHRYWSAGLGVRLAGAAVIGLGALIDAIPKCIDPADFDCPTSNKSTTGTGFYVVGGLVYAAGIAVDLIRTRGVVRAYNKEHASVSLAPMLGRSVGVTLIGAF